MEASIQEVARLTGTTSRTLRHYDAIGLLEPSRVGDNGYRWYDDRALVRLQRILLLRGLGLGLPDIRRVLEREQDETAALRHLDWLHSEQRRLERQAASVERTIRAREDGGPLMAEDMFDGFDHTQHKEEVERRWGADAYATSDAWWRGMSDDERSAWKATTARLATEWGAAADAGTDPTSDEAQELGAAARRLASGSIPGTPGHGSTPVKEYVVGLAEMYVADPRFAAGYGGEQGATFVRDALHEYAARHL